MSKAHDVTAREYPHMPDIDGVSVAPLGERYTQGWLAMLRPLDEHSVVDPVVMATLAEWLERCQLTADARATAWAYATVAECQDHMNMLAHEFPGMDEIPPDALDLYDCRAMYLALKARRVELANPCNRCGIASQYRQGRLRTTQP